MNEKLLEELVKVLGVENALFVKLSISFLIMGWVVGCDDYGSSFFFSSFYFTLE